MSAYLTFSRLKRISEMGAPSTANPIIREAYQPYRIIQEIVFYAATPSTPELEKAARE